MKRHLLSFLLGALAILALYAIGDVNGRLKNGAGTEVDLGTYTTGTVQTFTNPNDVRKVALFAFPAITMTGYGESTNIVWKLTRVDSGNTDAGDIALLDFDFHYKNEKFGRTL